MTGSTESARPRPGRAPAIVRDGLGVGVATGAYGVSFGAVSVAAGLGVLQTCALSLLVFTGASQFALVGVIAAGGAPLSGALTALLLGTRNTLYGLRLAPLLDWRGWRRAAAAHLLIDESTAMSVTRETTRGRPGRLPVHRPGGVRALEPLHPRRRRRRRRRSATRAPTASTPRSAARSWRCSGRGCTPGATGSSACSRPRSPWASSRSPRPAYRCSRPAGVALARRPAHRPDGGPDDLGGDRSAPASAATCSSSPACPCRPRVLEHPLVERIADLLPGRAARPR